MKSIRHLEIHLAHGCNLSCESCSHYSNQGHKGLLSLAEADRWLTLWSQRISPATFSLLGGEPTIHPELTEMMVVARRHWPAAHLRLVTNGFFLYRHPDLPIFLQNDPNACIYLSIHHDSAEYLDRLRPVETLLKNWTDDYGVRVEIHHSFKNWTRRYHGIGSSMEPFKDDQPRRSWENCPARYCPQLFEGAIWKCGPLAYLKLQNAKYRLSESWEPYLRYQPLQPDCSDAQLSEYFDREEESSCRMCSANPERLELPVPLNSSSRLTLGESPRTD